MDSIQSMASSSSPSVPSAEQTSYFSCQTEMEMESSKAHHWSQVDYSTTDSESSAESNYEYFTLLKNDPRWARFFTDFEALEVGEKISAGAQADIYEARNTRDGPFNLVVKVMKGHAPLQAFQAQWPKGMLSARSKYKCLFDLPLITILGGTVLRDERLRGRFAFVMYRRWGDLRLLIDRLMKQERSTVGPFPIDEAIHLMLSIAEDMKTLHNKHSILHRDLKASNVLVWRQDGLDTTPVAPPNQMESIGSVVADFECSVGVLGTGLWRAPEILEQSKARVPGSKVLFTRASDVYSYGMTCFEIVTGCYPHNVLGGDDTVSQILQGRRPELPHDLPDFVRDIIVACWHSHPSKRPSFAAICMALKLKRGPYPVSVDINKKSERGASIVMIEQWNNPLTLLEGMQQLMDMGLSILKAFDSSSTTMITHYYYEVTDWKGRKVEDDEYIANVTEALRSLSSQVSDETEWITEVLDAEWVFRSISIDGSIDGNTIVQMYVIEVIALGSTGFLGDLSRLLVAMNFRIHSAGCWTRENRVCGVVDGTRLECVVYVEGTEMGTLLWKLRHDLEYFRLSTGLFKIIVQRVEAEEFSHLNRRLHNLKSMDLTRPRSSSNTCVHQRKKFFEGFRPTEVVVCLEDQWPLVSVSRKLADMDYKIVGPSTKCPGPYDIDLYIQMGRVDKSEDIDVEIFGEDEPENMIPRIPDIATERSCPAGNVHLVVSGESTELHGDLMKNFCSNDLVVTGGQVCRDGWEFGTGLFFPSGDLPGGWEFGPEPPAFPSGSLEFFVTEKRELAKKYRSM